MLIIRNFAPLLLAFFQVLNKYIYIYIPHLEIVFSSFTKQSPGTLKSFQGNLVGSGLGLDSTLSSFPPGSSRPKRSLFEYARIRCLLFSCFPFIKGEGDRGDHVCEMIVQGSSQ